MKVLHLTTHLNMGGITVYLLRLVRPLKDLGIEMSVISSGGELTSTFNKHGAETYEFPIRTKNELHPKVYAAVPRVARLVRENKISLIHAHTRITQVLAYWAGKLAGVPVATTCHGFYKRRLGRRILPAWGDRAIAISPPVEDSLIDDFKINADKIRLIYNAVDVVDLDTACRNHDPGKAKESFGFGASDPVIGVVARLVQDKGHEFLIHAVPLLLKEFPALRLLIVGEGKYRSLLEKMAAKAGIGPAVLFTGNLIDISRPLAAMDVFILPATWREGFGLSIVEAMACRKPVIATNIWSLNTLIRNRVNGVMVEPKEVEGLAAAIGELLRDPVLRGKIGTEAQKMVAERFSIQRMAQEMAELYREMAL